MSVHTLQILWSPAYITVTLGDSLPGLLHLSALWSPRPYACLSLITGVLERLLVCLLV